MTQTILWPRAHPDDHQIELSAIGEGFNPVFCSSFDEVTDAQWASADAVVGPAVPPQHIPKLTRCRIYVKPAVGFDDVDLAQFSAMGIPVCNTPDYGTREVADHAMALMLTLTKSIAFHDESLRADLKANWRPALNPFGRRMADCTLGVVGVGRIGTAAVLRAKAFDMDVVFYDPHQPSGYELALGVRRAALRSARKTFRARAGRRSPPILHVPRQIVQTLLALSRIGRLFPDAAKAGAPVHCLHALVAELAHCGHISQGHLGGAPARQHPLSLPGKVAHIEKSRLGLASV